MGMDILRDINDEIVVLLLLLLNYLDYSYIKSSSYLMVRRFFCVSIYFTKINAWQYLDNNEEDWYNFKEIYPYEKGAKRNQELFTN